MCRVSVRFLGDMVLNLWDCGGQDQFYESYFNVQQEYIFRAVEVRVCSPTGAFDYCVWCSFLTKGLQT